MAKLKLSFIWNIRNKLYAEGDKLYAEGSKLRAEGNKLYAEGNKLYAEGDKLRAEGDKLWAEAIIECYGNITLEWVYNAETQQDDCVLENGKRFVMEGN